MFTAGATWCNVVVSVLIYDWEDLSLKPHLNHESYQLPLSQYVS